MQISQWRPDFHRKSTVLVLTPAVKICQWLKYFFACVNKGVTFDVINRIRMPFSVMQLFECTVWSVWTPDLLEWAS